MEITELRKLVDRLVALSKESETVEFKENFHSKEEIGERISALSKLIKEDNPDNHSRKFRKYVTWWA